MADYDPMLEAIKKRRQSKLSPEAYVTLEIEDEEEDEKNKMSPDWDSDNEIDENEKKQNAANYDMQHNEFKDQAPVVKDKRPMDIEEEEEDDLGFEDMFDETDLKRQNSIIGRAARAYRERFGKK